MAETKQLFPVFDVPDLVTDTPVEEQKYKGSVYFDFSIGDFRRKYSTRNTFKKAT
jgi:hypothetical protein